MEGRDLNRQFRAPHPPLEVKAYLRALNGHRFDLALALHEDYDARGFYLSVFPSGPFSDRLFDELQISPIGVGANVKIFSDEISPKRHGLGTRQWHEDPARFISRLDLAASKDFPPIG